MRRIILVLALGWLTACAGDQPYTSIGDDFRPYVSEFYTRLGLYASGVDIKFVADAEYAAESTTDGRQHMITVNRRIWDMACEDQRRALILHELAHVALGREHTAEGVISYMAAQLKPCDFYVSNRDALIEEMFTF